MGHMDRYNFMREQLKRDKLAGRSNNVFGDVFHVLPGASATHLAYARSQRRNVYATMDEAYALMVSGRGDVGVLWSGAHTPTAKIAQAKDDVSWYGWEAWLGEKVQRPSSIVVGPAADAAFAITAANAKFIGLTCRPVTTKAWATFTGAADGLTVRNCYLDLHTAVVEINTAGFVGSAAIDDFRFEENLAWSDGAQGPAVQITGANLRGLFRNNHYHVDAGSWASAVNLIDIDGIVVDRDLATCGGTAMTACFTGSGTTVIAGAVFKDCRKGVLVTLLVDGFGTTSHAEIVGNHTATIGGGTGETLVTVIT